MAIDKPPSTQQLQDTPKKSKRTPPNWAEIGIFAFTFIYVIVNSLYCYFSYRQWQEMKRLNTITLKVFEQSNRARFDPENFSSVGAKLQREGEILPVDVIVRNVGRSNAKVSISGEIVFGQPGTTVPPCNDTRAPLKMSEPVNMGKTEGFEFAGRQLTSDQIPLAETGRLQVFAIGKIRSTDEIGETHCTLICAYLEPTESVLRVQGGKATKQIWKKCPGNGEEDN
jgi:hypothetical protein